MDIVELRELCLSFPHTTEEFPFDETTLVFKVFNKMFCCTDIMPFEWIAVNATRIGPSNYGKNTLKSPRPTISTKNIGTG